MPVDLTTLRVALRRQLIGLGGLAASMLLIVVGPALGADAGLSRQSGTKLIDSDNLSRSAGLDRRHDVERSGERESGRKLELSKQLTTKLVYSDNLSASGSLNRSGDSESGGFIWEIVPGFALSARRRHFDANVAYSAQASYETGNGSGGRVNHRLQADLTSELYEDHLFLDLALKGRQELIDAFSPGAFDTSGLNKNQQTAWTYRIKPSYRQRFGRYSDLQLDLESNGVLYSETEDDKSQGYVVKGRLTSGAFWEPAFSELRARYEEEQYQNGGDNRFASVQSDGGYRIDRRWRFLATAGYESNDYVSSDDTSGPIWGVGMDWTPTVRTQLLSRIEHHYYGWSPRIEVSHRSKRSRLSGRYVREIDTAQSQRLRQSVYAFEDAFGNAIVPEVGADSGASSTDSASTSAVSISDRLELEYSLQTRRSTATLGFSYESRDYERQEADEEVTEGHFSWGRDLSPQTKASLLLRWNDRRRAADKATTDHAASVNEYAIDLGVHRKLSEHMSASIEYGFRDYEDGVENRVTASLSLSW